MIRCGNMCTSSGFLQTSQKKLTTEGSTRITKTEMVQNIGEPEQSQPNKNINNKATGTRLRRRLSKIFHLDKGEIGFLTRRWDPPGTHGQSQLAICQSPRIQRCLRFISTS